MKRFAHPRPLPPGQDGDRILTARWAMPEMAFLLSARRSTARCCASSPRRAMNWEHVSVSKIAKTPNWAEMELVKRMFFRPDEVCMQLHVAEAAAHLFSRPLPAHLAAPSRRRTRCRRRGLVGPKKETAA